MDKIKWLLVLALYGPLVRSMPASAADLDAGFAQPPASARPWVYWFWLNGNLTRQGITADLQAVKRVGIGGVFIMEVDQGAPPGPAPFASAPWRELFQHVVSEANRLGLEVNMNNDAGWNGSGGPWVPAAQSMQKVMWTETEAQGPAQFQGALPQPQAVAGYYRDIAVLAVPTPASGGTSPNRANRIADLPGKTALVRRDLRAAAVLPDVPAEAVIVRDKVADLTAAMGQDGHLAWNVPAGKWTLLWFGHTSTGRTNHPAPEAGRGLECDKLSKEAVETHFTGLMAKLCTDVAPLGGKTLVATHIDSWEIGSQNWTPGFREEFQRRRGYDLLPYMPVLTGRVVTGAEVSERFLWDLRQTISELLLDNYASAMAELAHRHGLRLTIEAYGDGPFDDLAFAGRADEPMGEFWSWPTSGTIWSCTEMASAAHVYGKPIVGAEAFTATNQERWLGHPGNVKAIGDLAFCEGINRLVFHRYALQPWLSARPGMSMGPWGLHYERTQTWWEQSAAWHEYLARCQWLLQQGRFVADVCYLMPEGAPRSFRPSPSLRRAPYNYDGCPAEVVLTRMQVRNGRLILPDGPSYRVLVLSDAETMTPTLLRKVRELVDAGATVIGTRPKRSPSLSGFPQCDAEVQALAEELWGRGKILADRTPEQVLTEQGVPPDFAAEGPLHAIHRILPGEVDVYFVANGSPRSVDASCTFRISGQSPELWWPDTGRIEPAAAYREQTGATTLPIRLDPAGSVFVVFRGAGAPIDPVVELSHDG
jgi:hypothetical protein